MKRIALLVAAWVGVTSTHAQERLPQEEASRYAALLGAVQAQLKTGPLATEPDLKHPVALRDGDYGILVLPDARFTAEKLAQAGPDVIPLGQLWFHKLAPLVDGRVIPNEKLRLVKVSGFEGEATVPCFTLGLCKQAGGSLELVVYGKDKEPLLKTPLKSISLSATQENPLEITAERETDSGRLTLKILGRQAAVLSVTDPELY